MILLLAGTQEARDLAERIAQAGLPAVASLAGATKRPKPLAIPVISGGFCGEDGFRAFLKVKSITQVIDATHPFADEMTARASRVSAEMGLRYLRLSRPKWQAKADDNWITVADWAGVAPQLNKDQTVFFATGRQSPLEGLPGNKILRVVEPIDIPDTTVLVARPPFSKEAEIAVFAQHKVDVLVTKNAGGDRPAKLDAAAEMGLPVVMIERPPEPDAEIVRSVAQAYNWIEK